MIETIELAAGVTLLAVQTEKFKSGCFSFNLMRPHTRAAAPLDALLPSVLLRGSERWPDMRAISMRLDELYGATLGTLVRLRGETKLTGFYADFIEEAFLPAGEAVFAPMVEFFRDVLFHPARRRRPQSGSRSKKAFTTAGSATDWRYTGYAAKIKMRGAADPCRQSAGL